jgi:acyl-CoA synthetase (AMP-forming)/AMP-acid ligase II
VVPVGKPSDAHRDLLREWSRTRLSPWKVPKAFLTVDRLPRNAMGKVDKSAVRAWFRE